MKQKLFLLLVALFAVLPATQAQTFDFTAASPNGQTLWYKINDDGISVSVVSPVFAPWDGDGHANYPNEDMMPAGNLVIPATVNYNGNTYTVTILGPGCLSACRGITALHIPATVTTMYYKWEDGPSLLNLSELAQITVDPANPVFDSRNNCNAIIRTATNCLVKGCMSTVIPDNIDTISTSSFGGSYITSITIPPSVSFVAGGAFSGSRLSNVTFQEGSNATMQIIEDDAFGNCQYLTSVHLSSHVMSIGNNAFGGSYNIESITIDLVNPIYDSRDNCNAIIVSNSNTLKRGCKNTVIPQTVTKIAANACIGDRSETNAHIVIPDWITEIPVQCGGAWGFPFVAASVVDITFPAGFQNYDCAWGQGHNPWEQNVPKIIFQGITPPTMTWGGCPIEDHRGEVDYAKQIVVPCGALSAWQADPEWGLFTNMSEPGVPQLTVNAAEHGSAAVVQYPSCGNNTATVNATAEGQYHFTHWNDGSTENPYTLVMNGDATLTAYFAIDTVTVTVTADATMGSAVGGCTVPVYGTATVTATPLGNNVFLCWSNGVTANPYTLTVTSDTVLTAMFTLQDTLVLHDTTYVDVHDTTYIDVHDTTYVPVHDTTYIDVPYAVHDTTIVTDTLTEYVAVHDTTYINVPYAVHDTTYIDVHDTTYVDVFVHDTTYIDVPYPVYDTTYIDVHDTTYVDVFVHDTAYIDVPYPVYDTTYIDVHDTTYITLTDTVTNTVYDTVTNTVYDTVDNYIYDTTFLHDTTIVTDTLWIYDTIYIHDTVYVSQEGVGDVEATDVKLYQRDGCIVVEGDMTGDVRVYDAVGRVVYTPQPLYDSSTAKIPVPASGVYLVKIGDLPARRVVVLR